MITDDFYPKLGGIAHTLMNLYKKISKTEHELIIFNPYYREKNIYKLITPRRKITYRDIISAFKKKWFYTINFRIFWKTLTYKTVPIATRIKLILYLLTKPKIFINCLENITRLFPCLKSIDFDLISCSHSGWILPLTFLLSRIFDKKIVTLAHGNDFLIKNPLTLKTYYFKSVDKIIVSNKLMKQYIEKIHHLSKNKVEIIYRGVSVEDSEIPIPKEELRKKYNIPEDHFIMVSVGRHNKRKRFDLVIRAISEIKKRVSDLKLKYFLIGEGNETSKLKQLSQDLNLKNYVKFLGPCENSMRNEYYKLSDLFLMPAITKKRNIEGFGIVFLEANYYKLPVIGTATGGIKEAIVDNETGFLIKPNDLSDLVEKILYLQNNKEDRKRMGENGYQRVLREYTWEKIAEDYIKLFKSL